MAVTIRGSGQIINQIVQTVKTDAFSMSSSTFTDITGLSVSITPSSASSRILVFYTVNATATGTYGNIRLIRNSTPIYVGDSVGSRAQASGIFTDTNQYTLVPLNGNFLDSPATTSSTTYKIQIQTGSTCYVNRTTDDRNIGPYDARVASSITVMEISG